MPSRHSGWSRFTNSEVSVESLRSVVSCADRTGVETRKNLGSPTDGPTRHRAHLTDRSSAVSCAEVSPAQMFGEVGTGNLAKRDTPRSNPPLPRPHQEARAPCTIRNWTRAGAAGPEEPASLRDGSLRSPSLRSA